MATTYARNQRELAAAVGRSPGQIQYYQALGAPTKKTKRGYNVDKLKRWMAANLRERAEPSEVHRAAKPADLREQLLKAQIAEREAAAELKAMRVRVERGDLLLKEDVMEEERARTAVVRRTLLGFERSLPPLLDGLDQRGMRALIHKRVRETLERLSKM